MATEPATIQPLCFVIHTIPPTNTEPLGPTPASQHGVSDAPAIFSPVWR